MFFGTGRIQSRLIPILLTSIRTATKRASGGKSANNKTAGRRLGPKKGEGEYVEAGQILWRQRGTKWFPGENAGIGRDHTIFAKEPGYVRYYRDPFHAKRRFIGIALGHSERLPTPHFEPRRRRFGYKVIDNPQVAAFESEFLTRKETQAVIALNKNMAARDQAREKRYERYISVLESAGFKKPVQPAHYIRLDSIYQFMCGGMNYHEAVRTVDALAVEDCEIACRMNNDSPEVLKSKLSELQTEASEIDSVVGFGAQRQLVPQSVLQQSKSEIIAKISELATPYLNNDGGTPQEVVNEVINILQSSPVLSPADVTHLKRRYLRRPIPVLLSSDSKKEFEAKAKKGDGKIQEVWDSQLSVMKKYFVPNRAKAIFS